MVNDEDVWRDSVTGLPIHIHTTPIKMKDEFTMFWMNPSKPCDCGVSAWDIPISAVQEKKVEQVSE